MSELGFTGWRKAEIPSSSKANDPNKRSHQNPNNPTSTMYN